MNVRRGEHGDAGAVGKTQDESTTTSPYVSSAKYRSCPSGEMAGALGIKSPVSVMRSSICAGSGGVVVVLRHSVA